MSKFLDHPLRLAAVVVSVLPTLHAVLALSCLLPLRRPGGFDGLAGGLLTASGFLASMAGIVVVFLLSERGTVFRSVRVALGETIAPQMLSLFALPAAAMVLTLLAMTPVPGAIATLCLEASGARRYECIQGLRNADKRQRRSMEIYGSRFEKRSLFERSQNRVKQRGGA